MCRNRGFGRLSYLQDGWSLGDDDGISDGRLEGDIDGEAEGVVVGACEIDGATVESKIKTKRNEEPKRLDTLAMIARNSHSIS